MEANEAHDIVLRAWERLCARWPDLRFDDLPHAEQVFFAVLILVAEVDNGGFCQYMFNSSGDQGGVVLGALREIGAGSVTEVCEQFYALLPDGKPARTRDERERQLDLAKEAIGEESFRERIDVLAERFYALEDDLHILLLKYLRANGLA